MQLFLLAAPHVLAAAHSPHDTGVRAVAQLSARTAYVLMCLTLCWGVFVSTGWVRRISGRQATRSSHMVLATLTLAFGILHAASFLFLTDVSFNIWMLTIPLVDGGTGRWALGIVGTELMLAISISVGLQRFFRYRRWLWLHRLGYLAVLLTGLHAFIGADVNGHLGDLWLVGLAFAVPTALIALLRFVPAGVLTSTGLVEEEA